MHLEFNQGAIRKQAQEIDQLQEGRQKLERELEEVSREYEKILFNFNSVI